MFANDGYTFLRKVHILTAFIVNCEYLFCLEIPYNVLIAKNINKLINFLKKLQQLIFFLYVLSISFLSVQWLQSHPKFIANSLYLAGDSYSGMIVPIIAQAISDGNYVFIQLKLLLYLLLIKGPMTMLFMLLQVLKTGTFQQLISK